jgi:hypothetical protein
MRRLALLALVLTGCSKPKTLVDRLAERETVTIDSFEETSHRIPAGVTLRDYHVRFHNDRVEYEADCSFYPDPETTSCQRVSAGERYKVYSFQFPMFHPANGDDYEAGQYRDYKTTKETVRDR